MFRLAKGKCIATIQLLGVDNIPVVDWQFGKRSLKVSQGSMSVMWNLNHYIFEFVSNMNKFKDNLLLNSRILENTEMIMMMKILKVMIITMMTRLCRDNDGEDDEDDYDDYYNDHYEKKKKMMMIMLTTMKIVVVMIMIITMIMMHLEWVPIKPTVVKD